MSCLSASPPLRTKEFQVFPTKLNARGMSCDKSVHKYLANKKMLIIIAIAIAFGRKVRENNKNLMNHI